VWRSLVWGSDIDVVVWEPAGGREELRVIVGVRPNKVDVGTDGCWEGCTRAEGPRYSGSYGTDRRVQSSSYLREI